MSVYYEPSVCIPRRKFRLSAQRCEDESLPVSRCDQVSATRDQRAPLEIVIHRAGELVTIDSITPLKHKVTDLMVEVRRLQPEDEILILGDSRIERLR